MPFSIRDEANRGAVSPSFTTTVEPMESCSAGKMAEPANMYAAACLSSMWTDRDTAEPSERKKLYAPPDSERVAKAVVDYLVTRSDVDASRIGLHGSSMGGYSGPRCATVERRIKAVAVWSGAYNLVDDIFDYYPPIQDRLRWLIGAKDLKEAREKIKEFTLEGRADRIACPLLVGYSHDDRVMDPRGALKLYEKAVNSPQREMLDGVGHGQKRFDRRTYIADWFMKQLGAG